MDDKRGSWFLKKKLHSTRRFTRELEMHFTNTFLYGRPTRKYSNVIQAEKSNNVPTLIPCSNKISKTACDIINTKTINKQRT